MPTSRNRRPGREKRTLATNLLSSWIKTSFIVRRLFQSERDACSNTVMALARNRLARRLFRVVTNNVIQNSFEGYAAERISRVARSPLSMPYAGPPKVTTPATLDEICRHAGKIMVFSSHTGFTSISCLLSPHRKIIAVAATEAGGENAKVRSGVTHPENVRIVESNVFSFAKFMKDKDHHIYCALADYNRSEPSPFPGVKMEPFSVAARYKIPVYLAKFVFQPDASVTATLTGPFVGQSAEDMARSFMLFQDRKIYSRPPGFVSDSA